MTVKEMQKLDDQGMKAWDNHDPEAWAEMFAEKFEWRDDTVQAPLHTRQEARKYMEAWLTAFPDMRVKTLNRVVSTDAVGVELEFAGTNAGPLTVGGQTIQPTNKRVTAHATYFAKAKDGKIVEFHSHPNVMEMLDQLGMSRR